MKKNEVVVYGNELNQIALTGFSSAELDLFMLMCNKMKDKGTELLKFHFSDLKSILGTTKQTNKDFYDQINAISKKMRTLGGTHEDEDSFDAFVLFPTFHGTLKETDHQTLGHLEKNTLTVRVNKDCVHLLNEISKNFTKFELQEFISLESKFSKNLYRILKQWRTKGEYDSTLGTKDLDEFKALIGGENYVTREFKRACIDVAVAELKSKGYFEDLEVEVVRGAGRGRPVRGYLFKFRKQRDTKKPDVEETKPKYTKTNKSKYNRGEERTHDSSYYDDLEATLT